jgi:hypothetical protein
MARSLLKSSLAGLLVPGLLCAALLSGPVRADYLYSPDYSEGAQAALARRYVDARTIADRLLESDPQSFEAHALLGQVQLRGEEDLGQAQHHFMEARRLLEDRFPPPLDQEAPVALHQEILRNLRQTVYLREQFQSSLELLDQYNALYDPDLDHLRGWPLLKLGRFSEAETAVKSAQAKLSPEDPRQVDLWDTLGQLAYERRHLDSASQHFLTASSLETDTADQPDPVYLTNLGEVYRDQLLFAEAEATWLEAVAWSRPDSYAEPHQRLACLYAGSARWEDALTQLEQSVAWRAQLWPQVAAHTRASHLTSVGEVLLAYGDSDRAAEVLRRALTAPNRQALSSGQGQSALAKRYLLYGAALELSAAKALEQRSYSTGRLWWEAGTRAVRLELAAAWARSQAALRLGQSLDAALPPYGPGAFWCPWLLPELSAALGPGPAQMALRDTSKSEAQGAYRPYRALLETSERARPPEPEALAAPLPGPEALAQAALWARGGRWAEALRRDPQVARREGLSIGIAVEGPPEVAKILLNSPRFHRGTELTIKVASDLSAVVSEQSVEVARSGPSPDLPSLAAGLHRALFSAQAGGWETSRIEALTREASPGRLASARIEAMLGEE